MNKSLFVTVIFVLLLCLSCGVMADAAVYDYNYGTVTECSYDVYVATVDGGVNLREAPTTESAIICTIADFEQLHITQKSSNGNGWGYTSYNGKYGWVALSQVSEYFPIKQTSYEVVVTASEGINHRDGPYTTYYSHNTIPYGTTLHVGATYNGWGEVEYRGTYAWVNLKYTVAADEFIAEEAEVVEEPAEEPAEEEVIPIAEEPVEEEAAVTSLEKEESGGIPIMTLLLGMIILVIVIAAVLIIVIIAKKK